MNREIKFRVFDKISKQMYRWSQIASISLVDFDKKHYELMQFTGLKNEKGIHIYDGDIVQVGGLIEVVTYIDGILCCYNERIYGKREKVEIDTFEDIIVASSDYFEPYEIIGNIYENPELLSTN